MTSSSVPNMPIFYLPTGASRAFDIRHMAQIGWTQSDAKTYSVETTNKYCKEHGYGITSFEPDEKVSIHNNSVFLMKWCRYWLIGGIWIKATALLAQSQTHQCRWAQKAPAPSSCRICCFVFHRGRQYDAFLILNIYMCADVYCNKKAHTNRRLMLSLQLPAVSLSRTRTSKMRCLLPDEVQRFVFSDPLSFAC